MKHIVFLKVALFSFICFVISIVGALISGIELISLFCLGFFYLSIIFLVTWVCTLLYKKFRFSGNVIWIIATAVASACSYITELIFMDAVPGESLFFLLLDSAFIFSFCVCLGCIMILVGRLIFSKPANPTTVVADLPISEVSTEEGSHQSETPNT